MFCSVSSAVLKLILENSVAQVRCEAVALLSQRTATSLEDICHNSAIGHLDTRTVSWRLEILESTQKSMFIYRVITKLVLDNVSDKL